MHVLGSFIFGLSTDRADTFDATLELAHKSGLTFAQFVMLTPFCGTVDFERWEKAFGENVPIVEGTPITRYWLIPPDLRPKMFMPHPTMNSEEMRARTQGVWDRFYSMRAVWKRSNCTPNLRARLAFHFYFEAIPADVCEHGHRYRQRAAEPGEPMGALAGRALPQAVFREADAGITGAAA